MIQQMNIMNANNLIILIITESDTACHINKIIYYNFLHQQQLQQQ